MHNTYNNKEAFMIPVPAMDLRQGKCVRLLQGDYQRQTKYSDDPPAVVRRFAEQGARRIHIVDLDGAKEGLPLQMDLICRLAQSVDVPVQAGGGIRRLESVAGYLQCGIQQVIIGTAAVQDPIFLEAIIREYGGDRIAVGLDLRDGKIAISGWLENYSMPLREFVEWLEQQGVAKIIVTDINKDGTLQGPNLELMQQLAGWTNLPFTLSGGIGELEDLNRVREAGIKNVTEIIVGKALYEGRFSLEEAIRILEV